LGNALQSIVFATYARNRAEHLARHRLADLCLDTFPYNSHSTARDALYAWLPILTCSGRTYASRVAGSLSTALVLPELITNNFDQYQRRAISLGQNPDEPQRVRIKLGRQIHQPALFDTPKLAYNLESLYQLMIERARAGLPPAFIDLCNGHELGHRETDSSDCVEAAVDEP
jgi:predicted O-linked N-acetylglucosamine transferase (SPINDLY family)